jgi:transcription termination factor Rho
MPDAKSVEGAPRPAVRKRVVKKAAAVIDTPVEALPEAPPVEVAAVVPEVVAPVAVIAPPEPEPAPVAPPAPLPEPVAELPSVMRPNGGNTMPQNERGFTPRPDMRPEQQQRREDRPNDRPNDGPPQRPRPMERRPAPAMERLERRPEPQQQAHQPRPPMNQGPRDNRGDNRGDHRDNRGDFRDQRDFREPMAPRQPMMPRGEMNEQGEPRPRPIPPSSRLDDLYRMPMPELFKLAESEGLHEHTGMSRAHLIVGVVRRQIERGVVVKGSGTLEVLPDGYGFLRSAAHNYLASPEDIYVSPSQIRRMSLRTGLIVEGPIRLPIENQDNFALMQIEMVNGKRPDEGTAVTSFDDLTALHPNQRFRLETTPDELSMRITDLITPIGKGQRGLIVAPPRTGKTILLSKLANAIMKNHPEAYVFVLLVDERPEEVTEMQRLVSGTNAEVVASTFDEPPEEHIHVSDIVLEKAKRMVENKRDVVILLDSITRLARAHNAEAPGGGKLLTGGLDSNAMQKPKRFFGAARNVEEGGSLTILATALIDTGSKMDDVIFEEFKGTGNSELHLDRRLVEKRVYPAIDVNASGTRKEDLLLHPEEIQRISMLRRVLADMHPVEAMELLINRAKKTKSNAEFLISMNLG